MGKYKTGDIISDWKEIDNLQIRTVLIDRNGAKWEKSSGGLTVCTTKITWPKDIYQLLVSTFGPFTVKKVGRG